MTILDQLAEYARKRVEKEKEIFGLEEMKALAKKTNTIEAFAFEKALKKEGICFICECKKPLHPKD